MFFEEMQSFEYESLSDLLILFDLIMRFSGQIDGTGILAYRQAMESSIDQIS
jgi:hypothetical protein